MKKNIITTIVIALPMFVLAETHQVPVMSENQDLIPLHARRQNEPESPEKKKYLAGAVPEVNGIVTFTQTFRVPGKNREAIYPVMLAYAKSLVEGSVPHSLRARLLNDDPQGGRIVVKVEEYMTFKKKFLVLDRAQFRYMFSVECQEDGKVKMTVTQISYGYGEDNEGNFPTTYKAEEWITDKEAINKAGTKLYPRSGKFRRLTIDRVNAIFSGARVCFDQPVQPVASKKATTVIE